MKNSLKIIIINIILMLISFPLDAQANSNGDATIFKHSISFQFNRAYDDLEHLIWHDVNPISRVFAFRYGYRLYPNIIIGPEISGFDFRRKESDTVMSFVYNRINIGGFSRYTINKFKVIKPFTEISLYYNRSWNYVWFAWVDDGVAYSVFNRFGVYIAPGITFNLAKGKIGIDLMYKFSNLAFANFKKSVFSWRITYNFNVKGC